jgi:hypothetical protein
MKRSLVICLAVVALLLVPTLATASKSGWSTQGSGTPAGTTQNWQWSAKSDVGGANVSGHFSEKNYGTNTYFSGDVTCLSVVSSSSVHTARIGVLITASNEVTRPLGSWTYFTMSTTNGSQPTNLVGADVSNFVPHTVCPPPSGYTTPFDGSITIRP